jgi:cytochrome c oxidase assembly protein subunit 15
MGWYMVKSGLVSRPEVSHFRLAAHFMLAVSTLLVVAWTWLELRLGRARFLRASRGALLLGGLILLQLVYGAFLAGTKAGWAFATFPTLNGEWFPTGAWALEPAWENLFTNGLFIHWWHRVLGTLLLALLWLNYLRLHRRSSTQRMAALALAGLGSLQYGLGVLTVLFHVPVPLGVAHQFVAILLASGWLAWSFLEARTKSLSPGGGARNATARSR